MKWPRWPNAAMTPLALAALAGCSNIIPMAGDNGPVPLDSTRAVALARRNVCASGPGADSLCPVLGYQAKGGTQAVTFLRRESGLGDTVLVRLHDHGMRMEVSPISPVSEP